MAKKQSAVKFQYIPFSSLVFLENNPRTRTEEGLSKMAADIQRDPAFYENRPTLVNLVNGEYRVYAGDLRAHAAHDVLGWADVPCNVETGVDAELMRRRAILDNTHREGWDTEKLAQWDYEPEELEEMGVEWGVDSDDESEGGIPDNSLNSEKVEEDDFEVPEIETVKTDIVVGDLFEIGPHRILCGDSTKAEDVDRLMGGAKIVAVVTDPPYGVGWDGNYSRFTRDGEPDSLREYQDIKNDDSPFDPSLWIGFDEVILWGGNIYSNRLPTGSWLIWDKRSADGYSFLADAEIAWQKGGYGAYIKSINQQSEKAKMKDILHPTKKPVALMAWCLERLKFDKYVLDPFLGSGTTMVASHQLNRVCYGCELEPKYCDVSIRRMLALDNTLTVKRNGVDETDKWLPKVVIP